MPGTQSWDLLFKGNVHSPAEYNSKSSNDESCYLDSCIGFHSCWTGWEDLMKSDLMKVKCFKSTLQASCLQATCTEPIREREEAFSQNVHHLADTTVQY